MFSKNIENFWDIAKISRILYGFYLGHNQNFTDTIWIVGPLGQAIRHFIALFEYCLPQALCGARY